MAREVAGIVRAMQILESLAVSPDGKSVRDLSRAIGCGKGTISRSEERRVGKECRL